MKTIDLNCDMGEGKPGQPNYDSEIMPFISSCNIACGFHSGTPFLIEQTIQAAMQQGVNIGAHPSYNDPEHFGRRSLTIPYEILKAELRYQICALKGMVESYGHRLTHVKPHGALYNDMVANPELADVVIQLIQTIDPELPIFALAHSHIVERCKERGISVIQEGFADRRYQTRTQLRSRQYEDAVLHDPLEVLAQLDDFLAGKVHLHSGDISEIHIETICLHSDTPGAVSLSQRIHHHLLQHHVQIAAHT